MQVYNGLILSFTNPYHYIVIIKMSLNKIKLFILKKSFKMNVKSYNYEELTIKADKNISSLYSSQKLLTINFLDLS